MPDRGFLPISRQVAERLHGDFVSGRRSGELPGVRRLAAEMGVNFKTVEAALRELEQEGLLESRGARRRRRIIPQENLASPKALRVGFLVFDPPARGSDYMINLRHLLEKAGYAPIFPDSTLVQLDMDVRRVARLVAKTRADAWVVSAGTREVLRWFVDYEKPAFALFGRRSTLPIAGVGPDQVRACRLAARRLIALGHQRIVILARRSRRQPEPGKGERAILKEMREHGIPTSAYNIPDWAETPEGFGHILDELFRVTPPTALIIEEPFLFHAAKDHLAHQGILAPAHVSMVCTDPDPTFAWCRPSVAHINWDSRPVVRRVVRWVNNIAHGRDDCRQTLTKCELIEGGTMGPVWTG